MVCFSPVGFGVQLTFRALTLHRARLVPMATPLACLKIFSGKCETIKGYSSDQSHFTEINVKLAEKNKYATHSVQRSLEMCENKEKPSVSEDFRQKKFYQ